MNTNILVFDQAKTFLGTVTFFEDGSLDLAEWAEAGAVAMTAAQNTWSGLGLPISGDQITENAIGNEYLMTMEPVLPHDSRFIHAFRQWAVIQGLQIITLEAEAVPCWGKIKHLPLSDEEKFTMICSIQSLPTEEIQEWLSALEEALKAAAMA